LAVVVVVLLEVAVSVADVILKQVWRALSTVERGVAADQASASIIAGVDVRAFASAAIVRPATFRAALVIAITF
jgi:hypothetical protein